MNATSACLVYIPISNTACGILPVESMNFNYILQQSVFIISLCM